MRFLPVADALDAEGLAEAVDVPLEDPEDTAPLVVRILRAEHIVATALKVNRLKDQARVSDFLTYEKVDLPALKRVIDRHSLQSSWVRFCAQAGIRNPSGPPIET